LKKGTRAIVSCGNVVSRKTDRGAVLCARTGGVNERLIHIRKKAGCTFLVNDSQGHEKKGYEKKVT
jgi:hypothetical protein